MLELRLSLIGCPTCVCCLTPPPPPHENDDDEAEQQEDEATNQHKHQDIAT